MRKLDLVQTPFQEGTRDMEPIPGQLLVHQYHLGLVVLSYFISCLGSFVALQCTRWMFRPDGSIDRQMTIASAVAFGGVGVWAMHFVGMVAFQLDVLVSYSLLPTLGSLVAAIFIAGTGLVLAGGRGKFSTSGWLIGSVLTGLGVAAMHYLGMSAMRLQAAMTFDPAIVALSVVIAITASAAALWIAFNVKSNMLRLASGFVMGAAVCSMHYLGMSAATLICTTAVPASFFQIRGAHLDIWVLMISSGVLLYLVYLASHRLVVQWTEQGAL